MRTPSVDKIQHATGHLIVLIAWNLPSLERNNSAGDCNVCCRPELSHIISPQGHHTALSGVQPTWYFLTLQSITTSTLSSHSLLRNCEWWSLTVRTLSPADLIISHCLTCLSHTGWLSVPSDLNSSTGQQWLSDPPATPVSWYHRYSALCPTRTDHLSFMKIFHIENNSYWKYFLLKMFHDDNIL